MWLATLIVAVAVVFLLFYVLLKYIGGNKEYWIKRQVPMLDSKSGGTFMEKLKLPFHELDVICYNAFKSMKVKYGGQVEFRKPVAFVLHPDLIRSILVKDFDHFVNRRGLNLQDMDPYFDKMLFNMEDNPWKEMRATISPTFTTGKIKKMFGIFSRSSEKFVEFLKKSIAVENQVDMRDSCGRLTLDVIASTAFGLDSCNFDAKTTIFTQMSERFNKSTRFSLSLTLKFIFVMTAPKLVKYVGFTFFDRVAMDFFAHVVKESIRERENKQKKEKRDDFLQLMLDAKAGTLEDTESEETGPKAKLTDDLILAQCVLFFLAGLDTTESLLIFAAYELALNPDVQEKLYTEVKDVVEANGNLSYDSINGMRYLDMVVSETLRKYPPAVRLDRRTNQRYRVPDTDTIWEKDTIAVIPTYAIHYDADIYPDPERFLPERFTTEEKAKRHPYTYMPFGLGPRSCVAMRFALVEAKTAIAHLVLTFKLEPSEKTQIPLKYTKGTTLKPTDGIWLRVKERE